MSTTENATVWYPNSGEGEFSGQSPLDIVDSAGNFLVDSSANNVTDDSTIYTPVTATLWSSNDGS
jgi:hypothetical protein